MKIENLVLLATASLALSAPSFAGSLGGEYTLSDNCQIAGSAQNIAIPAGTVIVSENIPVTDSLGTTTFPAIIFQAGIEVTPVLTLGVGMVQDFQFGPEPFSVGTYAQSGAAFTEVYSMPDGNGGAATQQTISLVKTGHGLKIESQNSADAQAETCLLTR